MSEATVRGLVKTVVEGVTNVGLVHDYQRLATDFTVLLDRFKTTISGQEQIRGWTISLEAAPGERMTFGAVQRTYQYKIRGYFGLKDSSATEKSALLVVFAVMDALDVDTTIRPGAGGTTASPCSLEVYEPRMFGSMLCHYAEITQLIRELSTS
jgi:hypothetical protein